MLKIIILFLSAHDSTSLTYSLPNLVIKFHLPEFPPAVSIGQINNLHTMPFTSFWYVKQLSFSSRGEMQKLGPTFVGCIRGPSIWKRISFYVQLINLSILKMHQRRVTSQAHLSSIVDKLSMMLAVLHLTAPQPQPWSLGSWSAHQLCSSWNMPGGNVKRVIPFSAINVKKYLPPLPKQRWSLLMILIVLRQLDKYCFRQHHCCTRMLALYWMITHYA